ncbi:hypothetical protein CHS0354_040331 [Potamilus streckersoni]|uniref:Uncharacterized protein n=1 Tax=Potamilus streckersoni TaxID=2493646 RepID=A0AAE0SH69_9BIVA|nr:hypothetical protein CHS0354_040331 [Potamilus streckersoni]
MVKEDSPVNSTISQAVTISSIGANDEIMDGTSERGTTDTIAAVTIAVLAVVIIFTLILVFRALRKRRRARQGQQLNAPIPTITTGIMGTGAQAYSSQINPDPVHSHVTWEPVVNTPALSSQYGASSV